MTIKLERLKSTLPVYRPRVTPVTVERLRGSSAVRRRARFLYANPLCVRCTAEGRTTAATVPDHVVPLWAGGADDLGANGQALCATHHDAKSRCEARMRAAGGWLSTACDCGHH